MKQRPGTLAQNGREIIGYRGASVCPRVMGTVTVERLSHSEPLWLGHWPASLMAGAAPLGVCLLTHGLLIEAPASGASGGPAPWARGLVSVLGPTLSNCSLRVCFTSGPGSPLACRQGWPACSPVVCLSEAQPKTRPSGTASGAGGGSFRLGVLAGLPIQCTLHNFMSLYVYCMCTHAFKFL